MSTEDKSELQITEELFAFLQGDMQTCEVSEKAQPKLTPDQAWTVIWYLGNMYHRIKDYIERCDLCGDLYDSNRSGDCLDYGKLPYHFCDNCMQEPEYVKKAKRRKD